MFCKKQACAAQKKAGGGAAPPAFANPMLASWVWKGLVCLEASFARLKKKGGGGLGRSPPPPPPAICKRSARSMGLEGTRMLSSLPES